MTSGQKRNFGKRSISTSSIAGSVSSGSRASCRTGRASFSNRHGCFAEGDVLRWMFEMVFRHCTESGLVASTGTETGAVVPLVVHKRPTAGQWTAAQFRPTPSASAAPPLARSEKPGPRSRPFRVLPRPISTSSIPKGPSRRTGQKTNPKGALGGSPAGVLADQARARAVQPRDHLSGQQRARDHHRCRSHVGAAESGDRRRQGDAGAERRRRRGPTGQPRGR